MTTPFDLWWAEYPRKVSKIPARLAYLKAFDLVGAGKLLSTVKSYRAATNDWKAEDRRFIPYPASWLNAGKYDDNQAEWVDAEQQAAKAKREAEDKRLNKIAANSLRRRREAAQAVAAGRAYWAEEKRKRGLTDAPKDVP